MSSEQKVPWMARKGIRPGDTERRQPSVQEGEVAFVSSLQLALGHRGH